MVRYGAPRRDAGLEILGRILGSEKNLTPVLPRRFVRGSIPTFDNPHRLMQPRLRVAGRVRQYIYIS